jgi:hypothetical protein
MTMMPPNGPAAAATLSMCIGSGSKRSANSMICATDAARGAHS